MDKDAQEKAAFVTRGGLWKWKVLPFGLTSAPATFERLMERVLHGLQWNSLLLYLDDVIVFSPDFDTHLQRLETVLQRLEKAHLKLKPSKCALLQSEVKYLGHVVSQDGVSTDPDKVAAVREWKTPQCQIELRTFLGFVGYYRRLGPDFATIAKPLNRLTAKGTPFQWGEAEQEAYDALRHFLMEAPVLAYPRSDLEFIVDTDASLDGVGAGTLPGPGWRGTGNCLFQQNTESAGKKLLCYPPRAASCDTSCQTFPPLPIWQAFPTTHRPRVLQWLYRLKDPHHQVARWLEILAEFQFTLQHRPGEHHENADGLSRQCSACKQCQSITDRDSGTPEAQSITIRDPLSQEVARLQEQSGTATQLIRAALLNGQPVAEADVEQGDWELKKLAEMIDLCELYKGILRVRLQHNGRSRWVTVCPTAMRPVVIQEVHTQHHSGINRTYQRVLTQWYWPGMSADIRRTVK